MPAPVHPDAARHGTLASPESHDDQHARLFDHEIQDTEHTNTELLAAAAEARELLAANPGLKRSDPARYHAARFLLSIKPLRVPTWPKPRKPRPSSCSYDASSRATSSSTRAPSSPSLPAAATTPAPQPPAQPAPQPAAQQHAPVPHPTTTSHTPAPAPRIAAPAPAPAPAQPATSPSVAAPPPSKPPRPAPPRIAHRAARRRNTGPHLGRPSLPRPANLAPS